jgi:hypothetical protein
MVHDGPISVAAAFRPAELAALVRATGAGSTIVQRHRPWFFASSPLFEPAKRKEPNKTLVRAENCSHGRMVSSMRIREE